MERERPFGVNIIAILTITNGLLVGASVLLTDSATLRNGLDANVSLGFLNIIFAIGLWMMLRWAWVATMLWTGVNLALGLWDYGQGDPNYVSMLINVLIVFYLNLREVQEAFNKPRSAKADTSA